jgi:uncharacterized protein (DUF433 family)
MGTIFIYAREKTELGSLRLAWLSVEPDGRADVFAGGHHLSFQLDPPPTRDESPLVLITRASAEAAKVENYGVPPQLTGERRSAYLERLADTFDKQAPDIAYGRDSTSSQDDVVLMEPVIVRRSGVMSGDPVFRGTRVPPAPIFAMLAELTADEIVRRHYPSVSQDEIELALRQACQLLELTAPLEEH